MRLWRLSPSLTSRAQFSQGLAFELPDIFTGHSQLVGNFLKGARSTVFEAKAQLEKFLLFRTQTLQDVFQFLSDRASAPSATFHASRLR